MHQLLDPPKLKSHRPPAPAYPERMSEEDFVKWVFKQDIGKFEWVDGKVVKLPAVSMGHDRLRTWFHELVHFYGVSKDLGDVYGEQVQSRLTPKLRRQPDVAFVSKSRLDIIRPNHIEGPPDLCIEVVSPDNPARDYRIKFNEYRRAGVKEYWLADPIAEFFDGQRLGGKRYAQIPLVNGQFHSVVLPGLHFDPDALWQNPLPGIHGVLRSLGVDTGTLP